MLGLVAVTALGGMAWADPTGTADVLQYVDAFVHRGASRQQTFLTTDVLDIEAVYYDPNLSCANLPPTFAQVFLFNSEGLVAADVITASTFPTTLGPKYRVVFHEFASVASIPLSPGVYYATILVRDCTNTKSIVLTGFLKFRVLAP
jgi:hypothetical protein